MRLSYSITFPCKIKTARAKHKGIEKCVSIVEKWSKEHPAKTRQSELLKLFPDTEDRNGVIPICPKHLIKGYECPENGDAKCIKCQEKFWLAEVE